MPELAELCEITAAIAAADAPALILGRILGLTTKVANGSASMLLVTPEQASAILPSGDPPEDEIVIGKGVRLVCRGEIADEIRDWEGAFEPFLTNDGARLILPLRSGGVAVQDPAYGVLADEQQVRVLQICTSLASGTVQMATRMAETEQRARILEQTRHRLREQTILLRDLAVVDELTQLYNRRFFEGRLAFEMERFGRYSNPLALVLFDVDHFKRINDTWGHPVGDEVLRHLARLVRTVIRSVDLFCRYGGEEFALLLPETRVTGATQAANRVRKLLEATPVRVGDLEVTVTVSAGVACVGEGWSGDPEGLVRAADQALYQAKRAGRNRVVVVQEAR